MTLDEALDKMIQDPGFARAYLPLIRADAAMGAAVREALGHIQELDILIADMAHPPEGAVYDDDIGDDIDDSLIVLRAIAEALKEQKHE